MNKTYSIHCLTRKYKDLLEEFNKLDARISNNSGFIVYSNLDVQGIFGILKCYKQLCSDLLEYVQKSSSTQNSLGLQKFVNLNLSSSLTNNKSTHSNMNMQRQNEPIFHKSSSVKVKNISGQEEKIQEHNISLNNISSTSKLEIRLSESRIGSVPSYNKISPFNKYLIYNELASTKNNQKNSSSSITIPESTNQTSIVYTKPPFRTNTSIKTKSLAEEEIHQDNKKTTENPIKANPILGDMIETDFSKLCRATYTKGSVNNDEDLDSSVSVYAKTIVLSDFNPKDIRSAFFLKSSRSKMSPFVKKMMNSLNKRLQQFKYTDDTDN